jgi:hypothetical protein
MKMRIRKRKTAGLQTTLIVLGIMMPLILGGLYVERFLTMYRSSTAFTLEIDSDSTEFYSLDEIDIDALEQLGILYDTRQLTHHTPHNLSQVITLNAATGNIIRYHATDNAGLHTGEALAGACFRYASLPIDSPERNQSLKLIRKMFTGLKMLIEVPNGGLGPNYSGVIARFYASPEMLKDGNYTWIMDETHYKYTNGTGKYENWRWRGYTSKDELGGYLLGISCVLKFVAPHDPWINENVRLVIGQFTEEYLKYYFQIFHHDGTPNGAHFQFPSGLEWKILITQLAKLAYPDNERYKQIHDFIVSKELGISNVPTTTQDNVIDGYYGYAYAHHIYLALIMMEEVQDLQDLYFRSYQKAYAVFKGHRNAYFNAIYLAMVKLASDDVEVSYNITKIRWDVLDQLWRFNLTFQGNYDNTYGGRNKTISRKELDPLGVNWTVVDPEIAKWRDFVENNSMGMSYKWVIDSLFGGMLNDHYLKPALVDMCPPHDFAWNQSPFTESGANHNPNPKTIRENTSGSYNLPFYLMKYYGYLKA